MNEIFATIESDLSGFGQNNLAPKSFTVGEGEKFRHYELGECFGVVAFGQGPLVMVCDIKEDDENWFCFSGTDKDYYDAAWVKQKMELYQRMNAWLLANMERGYYHGQEGVAGRECGFKSTFKK